MKSNGVSYSNEEMAILDLLTRSDCPTPFHIVRALIFGRNISLWPSEYIYDELVSELWKCDLPDYTCFDDGARLSDYFNGSYWD